MRPYFLVAPALVLALLIDSQTHSTSPPPVVEPLSFVASPARPDLLVGINDALRPILTSNEAVWNAAVAVEAQRQKDAQAATAAKPVPRASSGSGSHRGYATARECVSMTEHGGSYDASSNPSHKGRYQFSRSAWISFGGVAEHWDNWDLATPAEQDAVFNAAWSQGPAVQTQQWLRWDGCGPPDGS